jgi:DNA-binding NtrC family response regulator
MPQSAFILIYDPDADRGDALRGHLRDQREFPCALVDSIEAAMESLQARAPDVIVARFDAESDGQPGRLIDAIRRHAPDAGLLAINAGELPDAKGVAQVIEAPATASTTELGERVAQLASKAVARREDRLLRQSVASHPYEVFEGLVGDSPKMRHIIERIQRIASRDAKLSVLILGETGTGKDLIAEAIHRRSPRAKKPFVAVNCAAFSESLLESQLFGHVKGAFTGAFSDQKGLFAAADGGTIFLDEIGEMPKHLQAKLLRVLEKREFMPLGSTEIRRVDVRIIAATNVDLHQKLESGEFRRDLYHRLHQWEIQVPPLRERRQDIPLLAHHFLAQAVASNEGGATGFSSQAMQALTRYLWPGNIRELRNLVEVLAVDVEGRQIELEDLPERVRGSRELATVGGPAFVGLTMAQVERMMIEKTLEYTEGNREQAAKMLGIGTRTLYRKLKEFGL